MPDPGLLAGVERYYSGRFSEHGPTARGVDWNSEESQHLRFEQLLRPCPRDRPFTINDFGCGYGSLVGFMRDRGYEFRYRGFDLSAEMIEYAQRTLGDDDISFSTSVELLEPAEFTVASGVFNVKQDTRDDVWAAYVTETIATLATLSTVGFGFNALTSYSDPEKMREDLYYASPSSLFDFCAGTFSRRVSLLADYGLYEFTILVSLEAG